MEYKNEKLKMLQDELHLINPSLHIMGYAMRDGKVRTVITSIELAGHRADIYALQLKGWVKGQKYRVGNHFRIRMSKEVEYGE